MPTKIKAVLATLLASLLLCCVPAAAFADNNVEGNVAFVNEGNVENMTIVGEGDDNHVVVTNTAASAPSPTGFVMANLPIFVIGLVIACIVAALIVRSRHAARKTAR